MAVVRTGGGGVGIDSQPLQSPHGSSLSAHGPAMASGERWPVARAVRADAMAAVAVDGGTQRSVAAAAVATRGQTSPAAFDAPADMAQRVHKRALAADVEAPGVCAPDAADSRNFFNGPDGWMQFVTLSPRNFPRWLGTAGQYEIWVGLRQARG